MSEETRRRRSERPTAADVARHAGLSKATVSYVLNNTPHQVIPQHTRERVLAAAAELGYTPSATARALSIGRSDVVLMLLPDWPIGPSIGTNFEVLSSALGERGLTFVVHPRSARRPISEVWKAITPAAVISFEDLDDVERVRLHNAGIKLSVALLDERRSDSMLIIPEQRVGRLQAEHLAVSGHRTLGYAWPDDERLHIFSQHRLDGVRQACLDLGIAAPIVQTVPLDAASAGATVQHWLEAEPTVTGICAYNDDVAMALLAGAHARGIKVPDDLAVIGADDIPAAQLTIPALSSVSRDQTALAKFMADSIVHSLDPTTPMPVQPSSSGYVVVRRRSA